MEKHEAEPVTKRKPSLCPTRCIFPSTVASLKPVTSHMLVVSKPTESPCDEWPPMKGFKDNRPYVRYTSYLTGIRDRLKAVRLMATEPP